MDPVERNYGCWVTFVIFAALFFLVATGVSVWAIIELVNWVVSQ